jgi:hypothetical protein
MLQIHYNNPTEVSGVVDTSGFELYYTPTLRKYGIQQIAAYFRSLFFYGK